jgi:hypothetical protein
VVCKALEYRLLKDHSVERDDFESAFLSGNGYGVIVPLIQGPSVFAVPALQCLATLVQVRPDNASYIASLSAIRALFGLPTPESKPLPSSLDQTLKTSPIARKCAAKLLAACIETQEVTSMLESVEEKCIKGLLQLWSQIDGDGKGNVGAFNDMVNVFYVVSKSRPGPLCKNVPTDILNILVEMSEVIDGSIVNEYASQIVAVLRKDKSCKRAVKEKLAILQGEKPADDDEPLLSLTSKMMPKVGR